MKKKTKPADTEVGPKITREQYNEWRCFIYAIDIEKFKLSDLDLKYQLRNKESEIAHLKAVLIQKNYSAQSLSVENAEKVYFSYRDKLGQSLGVNMDGAIVDPVTLSISLGGKIDGSN